MNTNKEKVKKVLLTLIVQILISIPIYIIGYLIFISLLGIDNLFLEKIILAFLFLISLHITLLILSKKFVFSDAKYLSIGLAIIYIGYYLIVFAYYRDSDDLITLVIYAVISFFYTKWFIGKIKPKLKADPLL